MEWAILNENENNVNEQQGILNAILVNAIVKIVDFRVKLYLA